MVTAAPSCATTELNGGVGCRGIPWIRIHSLPPCVGPRVEHPILSRVESMSAAEVGDSRMGVT